MLRKNEPVKFTRPDGVMKTVYGAVEQGCSTRREIEDYTGLDSRRVKAAVYNLVFVGVICRQGKRHKSTYHLPDTHPQYREGIFPNCFKGVRSVFDAHRHQFRGGPQGATFLARSLRDSEHEIERQ
jgi:hypothetical protein